MASGEKGLRSGVGVTEKKKGLGRGLAALIPPARVPAVPGETSSIPVGEIVPNPRQPREEIDHGGLDELVNSIKERGILQPIIVRKRGQGYEIIAGERRWRAAVKAGLARVPVVVREAGDADSLEMALIENLQREDLNPMEEAHAFRRLMEDFSLTQEEVARRVGKERSTVSNSLRLLRLPPSAQDAVRTGAITSGHARALLGFPTAALQEKALKAVLAQALSVRQAEAMVQHSLRREKKGGRRNLDPDLVRVEEQLKKALGTQVRIRDRGGKGRLEIEYYSWEDLDRILEHVRK